MDRHKEKRRDENVNTYDFKKSEEFVEKIAEYNANFEQMKGRKKQFYLETYGCQMNEHDSEKLAGMLHRMGYTETDALAKADLVIYNTCCVRENAELKVYGNLGHLKPLKKKNPDMLIAVCGCMMQQAHVVDEIKRKYSHVDMVFGTHNLHNFPQLLANSGQSNNMIVEVWDEEGTVVEGVPVIRKYGLKAFVNITFGCNNFCSYCIVPYTRGRERSRTPEEIISEIEGLAKGGTKEITLLGQNVNSYGKTLDEKIDFAELLYRINKIDGIERIRFMTSHPKDLSYRLVEAIRDCDKICEHIHLPVQSGSTKVLNEMNRHYSKEKYLEIVDTLKKEIPNIAISTDIIVGFPGETEEDFQETLDLVEKVQYDSAFTFLYSIREGTPAAKYDNQIPEDIKHDRFNRLLEVLNPIVKEKNGVLQDQIVEVLVEGESKNDETKLMGRTRTSKQVNFPGSRELIGKIVLVKITECRTFSLNGVLFEHNE